MGSATFHTKEAEGETAPEPFPLKRKKVHMVWIGPLVVRWMLVSVSSPVS
jgi:hypothetical protein